jgi:enoyl-CoA hydratase/carnithine racemase
MTSRLLTERNGAALVLTLSDPPTRNTLSEPLLEAGLAAIASAAADDTLRALVLRGDAGQFCAGGKLQGLVARREAGPAAQRRMLELLHRFVDALRACPKPVIAAVEGAAAGAGFSIVLACDLVVAAEDARFILSHGRLGLTPDGGATWSLARTLPPALAREIVWLAEPISAVRLHALGLVNRVTDKGGAFAEAAQLAERLAAMAPNALAAGKALLAGAPQRSLREQLDAEREQFIATLFHANGGEGLQAFLGKRAPRFE